MISSQSTPNFKKPKAVMCYICGREFGTASINIHVKQCIQKWEQQEEKKPKHQRRPVPQPPQEINIQGMNQSQLDEYNQKAYDNYNKEALLPCLNCGRTFLPESLVRHAKACTEKNPLRSGAEKLDRIQERKQNLSPNQVKKAQLQLPDEERSKSSLGKPQGSPARPKFIMCYICGREYGQKSLPIHIKTCKEKFLNEESKKPKAQRRPLPEPPQNFEQVLSGEVNLQVLDSYNDKAFTQYNDEVLVPCENCGRTFLPDSLAHHIKHCQNDTSLVPCQKCGRKFNKDRVEKHEGVCKGQGILGKLETNQSIVQNPSMMQTKNSQSVAQIRTHEKQPAVQEDNFKKPKTIVCFICGREYGTKSINIHLRQCEDLWIKTESKKPEGERRPLPQKPDEFSSLVDGSNISQEDLEQYNQRAMKTYNQQALIQCPNCFRTFKPESMAHHEKACTPDKPAKAVNQQRQGNGSSQLQVVEESTPQRSKSQSNVKKVNQTSSNFYQTNFNISEMSQANSMLKESEAPSNQSKRTTTPGKSVKKTTQTSSNFFKAPSSNNSTSLQSNKSSLGGGNSRQTNPSTGPSSSTTQNQRYGGGVGQNQSTLNQNGGALLKSPKKDNLVFGSSQVEEDSTKQSAVFQQKRSSTPTKADKITLKSDKFMHCYVCFSKFTIKDFKNHIIDCQNSQNTQSDPPKELVQILIKEDRCSDQELSAYNDKVLLLLKKPSHLELSDSVDLQEFTFGSGSAKNNSQFQQALSAKQNKKIDFK